MVPDVLLRPLRSPGQPGQQGLERGTGCWPRQERPGRTWDRSAASVIKGDGPTGGLSATLSGLFGVLLRGEHGRLLALPSPSYWAGLRDCCGVNADVPAKPTHWNPSANMTALGSGAYGRQSGHRGDS